MRVVASAVDPSLVAVMHAKQALISLFTRVYRELYLEGGLEEVSKRLYSDIALQRWLAGEVCSVLALHSTHLGTVVNLHVSDLTQKELSRGTHRHN